MISLLGYSAFFITVLMVVGALAKSPVLFIALGFLFTAWFYRALVRS